MKLTTGELHSMDFGVHCHLLEEWNESSRYTWHDDVEVMFHHPHSTVIHRCTERGELPEDSVEEILIVAQYRTDGEGDILSMYIFDRKHLSTHDYVAMPKEGPEPEGV
jgi:hypothetical protein